MAIAMFGTNKTQNTSPGIMSDGEDENITKTSSVVSGMKDPVPVVQVLSVRGVEYGMMSITLWVLASTLAWLLLNLVNGSRTFDYLVVPTSALVVCLPFFAWLFIRLKKAELANSSLVHEPSRRRWSQTTQFVAFIATLTNLIVFVYAMLSRFGTDKKPSETILKQVLSMLVVLVIAGGVLVYYWLEDHRK